MANRIHNVNNGSGCGCIGYATFAIGLGPRLCVCFTCCVLQTTGRVSLCGHVLYAFHKSAGDTRYVGIVFLNFRPRSIFALFESFSVTRCRVCRVQSIVIIGCDSRSFFSCSACDRYSNAELSIKKKSIIIEVVAFSKGRFRDLRVSLRRSMASNIENDLLSLQREVLLDSDSVIGGRWAARERENVRNRIRLIWIRIVALLRRHI